jgi:molecular chaperone GrpE
MSSKEKKSNKQSSKDNSSTKKKVGKTSAKVDKNKLLIEKITIENKDLEDKLLRSKAEFENFRKRKEKEIIDMLKYEGKDVINSMISIVDDLDRLYLAIDTNNDSDKSLQEGVSMIQAKIDKIFADREIVSFCEEGDILDSDLHDALMVKQEKNKKDNEILEVFEKGYKYRDRVIRHAKVVVNKS